MGITQNMLKEHLFLELTGDNISSFNTKEEKLPIKKQPSFLRQFSIKVVLPIYKNVLDSLKF